MEAVVCTVVYPSSLMYWRDFLNSLISQDEPTDLVVVHEDINPRLLGLENFRGRTIAVRGTNDGLENRRIMIEAALGECYEWLIFADSDDYFDPARNSVISRLARNCDCVVNDLAIIDRDGQLLRDAQWSGRLGEEKIIDPVFLEDKNIMGLSNTAIKADFLKGISVPSGVLAADWYLFTLAIRKGARALFTSSTRTYYRQHGNNAAGAVDMLSAERVSAAVRVKAAHYRLLPKGLPGVEPRNKYFGQLSGEIDRDPLRLEKYMREMSQVPAEGLYWWENAPFEPKY